MWDAGQRHASAVDQAVELRAQGGHLPRIDRELARPQRHHLPRQQRVERGELIAAAGRLQAQVQIVGQRCQFALQAGALVLGAAPFALDRIHATGAGLLHQRYLRLERQARFERAALGQQRELLRQLGMPGGDALQFLLPLARQQALLGQFEFACAQALLLAADFGDALLQARLAVGKVPVPGGQPGVDQGPVVDQLAAQDQPFAGIAFERGDLGPVRHRRLVLGAVGIDVGKGLVPFGLEIDVGIGQVAPEDAQQVVLDLARTQPVQPQGAREHAQEGFGQARVLELENGEVRLVVLALLAAAVDGVAEFARRIAKHQFRAGRQVRFQLRLGDDAAVRQAEVLDVELALVGEVFVIVAHALAHAAEHDRAGGGQGHFEQDERTVVGKVEAPAPLDVVGAEIHAPLVDDEEKLQRVDQAGLAGVVGRDQRDGRVERQFGPLVAGAAEHHQALEAVLHHGASPSVTVSSMASPARSALPASSSKRSR